MNSLLVGLFAVLTPDVLAALGRILVTASKIGDVDRESFLAAVVDAVNPANAAETAAKAIGAELDALRGPEESRADVLVRLVGS